MPQGGELRFTLSHIGPQEPSEAHTLNTLNLAHAEHLKLCVEDTGTGIKPEVIEHIFEPFFTTKKEGEGTGLGLASAYQLMRRSGGLIVAESEIETGARFTLYFPLARPH
jgi:signal transduction histidine kinase